MAISHQSFEPRVATAQTIFGVIYVLITLIALSLAFYARSQGLDGYLQMFMAGLFAIMAIKSFVIAKRVKSLLANGQYFEGTVDSIDPVRGITTIKGTVDIPDFGLIYIESRLVGETVAHELKRYLTENKQTTLPAIVVGIEAKRPRGLFTVKTMNGHLDEASAKLKSAEDEQAPSDEAVKSEDLAAQSTVDTSVEQAEVKTESKEQEAVQAATSEELKPDAQAESKEAPATDASESKEQAK